MGYWLINFLAIQFVVTLVSLPCLIAWGLPLSMVTPIANIIFSPFLTGFLFISSLIFITELCGIPNGPLITLLEWIYTKWNWLLHYGTNSWLLYYQLPSLWIISIIIFIPFLIVLHKKTRIHHIALLSFITILITTLLLARAHKQFGVHSIDCLGKEITLITSARNTMIIDVGALGHKLSTPSWVEYTLIPLLAQQYGIRSIDHLVLLKPGKMVFDAATTLCQTINVNNVHMAIWHGEAQKNLLRSYFTLKNTIESNNANLKRIGYQSFTIKLDNEHTVNFTLTDNLKTYSTVQYPEITYYTDN